MFHRLLISLTVIIFSVSCLAQDVFILPADEQTPSSQRHEKSVLSARQSLTVQDHKKDVYEDLKYYFQTHEWISIGMSFAGYFEENAFSYKKSELDKYSNEILASLPKDSYREASIGRTVPTLWLYIKKSALEPLYKNEAITAIHIDRYANTL